MKIVIYGVAVIALIIVIGGIILSIQSHSIPKLGLVNGHLPPCPSSPNCVCSESTTDAAHHIDTLPADGSQSWQMLAQAITMIGGTIDQHDSHYLHATFTSALFRFVDDFEAHWDEAHKLIHLRSASRVGRSDLGANRKRIAQLQNRMERLNRR